MSLKPKRINFAETWEALQQTVKGVITLDNVPKAVWYDRFSDVYSLCVAYPEPLADRLYKETKVFLDNHVANLLDNVMLGGEQNLLRSYYETWNNYSKGVNYLHCLYQYLNQQHIKKQQLSEVEIIYGNLSADMQEQMEIGELGLEIWKRKMIEPLKDSLIKLLLEEIQQDRLGSDTCNSTIIQGTVQSFVYVEQFKKKNCLQLYTEAFETPFLEQSAVYYKQEATRLLEECDASKYVERVIEKLNEESLRSSKFLHTSSAPKINECLLEHMVSSHLVFLHGECQAMVQEEREKDLNNMYKLLKSVKNGLSYLVNQMYEHVKAVGSQSIAGLQGENVHTQFVENILGVHKKFRAMIEKVFNNDQAFVGALDKACSSVINMRPNPKSPCQAPEMLAKFHDSLLKKSLKGMSETEIDEQLTDSITIFKYIDDKDVFQKFYARFLAKRMIHQQSNSMDAEEAMINKLKQTCGYEFTSKLHRMFMDISLSTDLNNDFNNFVKTRNTELGINFFINVLQTGAWPVSQTCISTFAVPQQLEKSMQMFEVFYHERFSGRKLTWLHHLCQGELKLNYLKKPYLVTMQTFQMAILLTFERTDAMTCKDIQEILQLNDENFSKHISSLIDAKLLVANNENVTDDTMLTLNMDYSNKRTKFRITAALQRETPQEVESTHTAIDKDRSMYLQADIVRIMKNRKILKHNVLVQEVLSQSKIMFSPSISMIKKSIESLIAKQYIERTPNSTDEYSYIA